MGFAITDFLHKGGFNGLIAAHGILPQHRAKQWGRSWQGKWGEGGVQEKDLSNVYL